MLEAGFRVVGVDLSPAMVELARAAAPAATITVGSVHDFEVPRAVAVVALGEVLNYATDERAGLAALEFLAVRVHEKLSPGGVFVFDVATPGRAGPTNATERFHLADDWALGMHAHEHDGVLERAITIFSRDGSRFRRVDERHVLRLYDADDVRAAVRAAGFDRVDVRDGYFSSRTFPGWKVFVAKRE
jgi:SAM-dependent methyltransferase